MKALVIGLMVVLTLALSYGITVGIIYLICLCFSWEFNILIASGVWLVLHLLRGLFS